jgi:amino acid adenylation domain-containing protein
VEINMEPSAGAGAGAAGRFAELELERVEGAGAAFTRWDIHIDTVDTGGAFVLHTTFNADLLEPATVERLLGQVERVLEQVAGGDDLPLGALELLGADERARLLDEWNRTETSYPADALVHRLFEARAARAPDAVALVCDDERLTFRELNERANRLAHRLRALGVGPDVPVALLLERGAEMVVALLGVLKAGGAYVALDAALPPERLAFMLADSGAAALVTGGGAADVLAAGAVPVVRLDAPGALDGEPAADPDGGAAPGHLAYLVYTSGSTGRPKGVAVEHRQLANYLFGVRDRLEVEEGASWATVSTLSADLGNTAVFSALAWGGTLHVLSEKRIFSGDAVAEYFAAHRVDGLKITPSHLAALQAGGDPRRVMPWRWLVLGGEASPLAWVDELLRAAPGCAVFNHYGPTEATVGALTFRVTPERPDTPSRTLVLGRPLPNVQVFVVDAGLRPVPTGAAGELVISGAGVARGYLGRPELTAGRFVANPFGPGRLYRTGDRCRVLPDGNVEFLGRLDDQVKIRGFRVEPGEVEAALREAPGVREAAVAARADADGGEARLVAYVVGDADAAALRDHLARSLPEYMVPAAFVALDALPLTPNGKVDRAALPAPAPEAPARRFVGPRTPVEEALAGIFAQVLKLDRVSVHDSFFDLGGHSLKATRAGARARSVLGVALKPRDLFEHDTVAKLAARVEAIRSEATGVPAPVLPGPEPEPEDPHVAPRTPVEEVLAGIFADVLKVERVSVHDSFFELGGHSLKATRVGARARAVFGVDLKPRDLFEAQTVARLAARVEAIRRKQQGLLPPVAPVERTGALPLSFAQERLWFLDRLRPGSAAYNRALALRLRGALDAPALERALAALVRRHEALRTVFAERDGVPVQAVVPAHGFALAITDLSGDDEAEREAEAARRAGEEARRPFDLAAGPLFRAGLLRLGPDDHVLLLSLHHIVSDGWSLGILFRELGALYGAYREGREPALPALAVQYADYAAWQREHLAGEALERPLAWWTERLAGAPPLLALPADHPRPARPTHRGAEELVRLPGDLPSRLNAIARKEGATLFMVLLGAFQALLARYAAADDVVVGSPVAGRASPEVEGVIGFFVNTLALRTDLSGDPSFRELLRRVRETTLGAYDRQDVPFEKVVEALHPERSLAHSPLFQAMFTMAGAAELSGGYALPGVRVEELAQDTGAVKFDLTLHCGQSGPTLWAALGYSAELFERETALRILAHFGRVLEQVAANADLRLSELELLDEAERSLVVEEWNATAAALPEDACVHALFEAQAERTPDAVALSAAGETVTYAGLDARANRLAHHLAGLGVGPDARVGVCMERGVEMVVGVLAVLKAGGAYVPLDPGYPADRLRQVVDDCAPVALLAHGEPAGLVDSLLGATAIPVVRPATDGAAWAGLPATRPARAGLTPDHLCYVIYTSGSTGRPKGVMNPHRSVANRVAWGGRAWGLGAGDAVLSQTSLGFDGSVRELFLPLSVGARVVLAPPGGHRDPDHLVGLVRREGVTTVNLVPSLLQALVEHPQVEGCAGVARVLCGGEALPGALLERVRERLPRAAVHNLYGPSEAATALVALGCGGAEGRAAVPVGRPIDNTRVYLLDGAGKPVPVGVAGELYVGGAGVARGYLGDPRRTAERFVPDPFGGEAGGRLYRTGDLGRRLGDGSVEFLGRTDLQVKVRGFRVEPGEVEACLAAHPGVREAVVDARGGAGGERRLVAWYVGEGDVDARVLRAHLSGRLPDYMVPAEYVRLEAFPRTPSGKLDRGSLPEPDGGAFAARGYAPPLGGTEEAVARIWADVLHLERVGRCDHFFELGGHSLRAVQVVSRVRRALGVEAPLGDVFLRPVLAEFARGLERGERPELPAIEPAPRDGPLPLSFAQRRLWFLDRMGETGAAYHVPAGLRLRGALDRAALEAALARIVARHEALRTVFAEDGGEPVQRVVPAEASPFRLADDDLSAHPDRDAGLRRVMAGEAAAPFDLERGPVVRGRLVRLAEDDHVLLLTVHHVACDGWSLGVLVRDLSALYAAFRRGDPDPLPPLPVQYADYAAWQRRWAEGEALRRQADYWKETLAGAPELLELPADRPRPARQDFAGGRAALELDEALTAGLRALARRHETTLFTVLLAGYAAVLGRLSGEADVVVGTPAANRGRSEVEGLIGFFVNTLALRVDLSGSPTVAELVGRVKARALEAQQHAELPFERVVELLRPARSLSYSPLFQAVLSWQDASAAGAELPGLTVEDVEAPHPVAKYDLSVWLRETGGRIVGGATYAAALFDAATVERWLGYLRNALRAMAMAEADGRRVDALPLLPPAERRLVVEEWNRTARPFPRDATLHALFAARAAERPDDMALEWDEERVTYAGLDARANRLAHHLARRGVRPDARVGVLLERGIDLVVSILAVVKAGGCYVPLDPAYPAARLRHMLADAGARVLVVRDDRAAAAEAYGADPVSLDGDADAIAAEPAEAPPGAAAAQSLAYIVYTSGSTGAPKGVMVSHRNVVQLVVGTDYVRLAPGDRVAQASNASFDALTFELWGALLNGATLVGVGRDVLLSPPALAAFLRERRITTLYQTTALLNQLARQEPGIFAPLREVLFGGQAADADGVRRILAAGGPRRLLHMYGPTETTAWSSWEEVTQVVEDARTVPVGRATGNQRVYLLDGALEPVPVGVPGEACVGGEGVVRGYLDRPALTAERFVPDPFAGEPGARMYRTGDRLRWREVRECGSAEVRKCESAEVREHEAERREDADVARDPERTHALTHSRTSVLEFVGRLDAQVKIRGFRIEPGEVESVLAAHPGVREVRVVPREDSPGETRLVAYLVGEAEAGALRAHLRESLPEYMVPAAFVALDRLPLTPSGKLDVAALPAPAPGPEARVEPRTPVEAALAAIWREVLNVERVGVGDDFFLLGGHSLLVMRLIAHVRAAFGVEIPIRAVFASPTLEAMAEEIEGRIYADVLAMSESEVERLAEPALVAGGGR